MAKESNDTKEKYKLNNSLNQSIKLQKNSLMKSNLKSLASTEASKSIVSKDNFTDYFKLNGDAIYDKQTGKVLLTSDARSKKGGFSLNSKIDMSQSFTLKGKVNLGNKTANRGGADGIGFAFHPNSINDIGSYGGGLGIGGLSKAFGFKLDTWYNEIGEETFIKDPIRFSKNKDKTMGAFVYTNSQNAAVTDESSIQFVSGAINNNFNNITIDYDGNNKVMKVTYIDSLGTHIFTKNLSDYIDPNESYTLSLSGSTGYYTNRQEFQIEQFEYVAKGIASVKYIDMDTGIEIIPEQEYQGSIKDTNKIDNNKSNLYNQGYNFINVQASDVNNFNTQTDVVTYTTKGQNIIYYFVKAPGQVISKYVDENGKELQPQTSINGKVGDSYATKYPTTIGDYNYFTVEGNITGKYNRGTQTVTYIYKKATGQVITKYVDENGKELQMATSSSGEVGENYSTTYPEQIGNYKYKEVNGNSKGVYSRDTHTVIYIYEDKTSESLSESESLSTSESLSESESLSTSESLSESESLSTSESLSESESLSTSESLSESESLSTSESLSESESLSTSESLSESESLSTSESLSESESLSTSESLSESESLSTSE
ncbi:MucBP domain-containing protein, partial [Staphylococcus equorum]|uniref:lectin-like domain-containing protein n=1 Tax=Staphylococcus equorum TaxID=246432 RepID=UPI0025566A61